MENCGNFCFNFTSHPRWLRLLRTVVTECLSMMGVEEKDQIVLAIDEACANVVRHAYGGSKEGRIWFECHLGPKNIEFILKDQGKAVDFEKVEGQISKEIKPGGMGVGIIRELMDEVEYSRGENGENIIRMVKYAK